MANRDRSQGFGFMYVDISKLIEKRKELNQSESVENIKTINFNKDRAAPIAADVSPSVAQGPDKQAAIAQIKQNLDRLQSLHHKLHAMLEELNKSTAKTTKSNS